MDRVRVFQIVYNVSHNTRCEPDAGTSELSATVIVSLFTDKNGLGMAISNVTKVSTKFM